MSNRDKIIGVLKVWSMENRWWGFGYLEEETNIPEKECKKIVRNLEKEGIVRKIFLYDEDTGNLAGSGYILTD